MKMAPIAAPGSQPGDAVAYVRGDNVHLVSYEHLFAIEECIGGVPALVRVLAHVPLATSPDLRAFNQYVVERRRSDVQFQVQCIARTEPVIVDAAPILQLTLSAPEWDELRINLLLALFACRRSA